MISLRYFFFNRERKMSGRSPWVAGAVVLAPVMAFAAPDLILHNANVLTLDGSDTRAEAIAITGNEITAVGSNEAILDQVGPDTRTIDVGGHTIIPGFVDAHTHLRGIAENIGKVDIADARSIAEVLAIVEAAVANVPPGTWVVTATGWQPTNLAENRLPTRAELDSVSPQHPVFLKKGWNAGVANTLALTEAGVNVDGDGAGEQYQRGEDGALTGEIAGSLEQIAAKLPTPDEGELAQTFLEGMKELNALGVTSIREAASPPDEVRMLQGLAEAGKLTLRIDAMGQVFPPTPLVADINMWQHVRPYESEWFTFDTLKIVADGGISDALLLEHYAWSASGDPHYRGDFVTPMDKIVGLAGWACDTGRKLAVHTIGDGMIDRLLSFYEYLQERCDVGPLGWTIEHIALVTPEQMDRIKRLRIGVTTQTGLNYNLAAAWRTHWGDERLQRSIPNRSLIDHGIHPGGGTDANTGPMSPFMAMWTDVTRQTRVGVVGKAQAITPLESLRMHTVWAAEVMGDDAIKATIEPGKLADLAVLDRDPLTIDEDEIKDIQATLTIVDGKVVFER